MAKEGRAGLGLWDRLILFVAWVVTCGMVYVLGFYVGKGTQERRYGLEERVVRLPVTSKPPPAGQRPKADELTFYETLGSGERDGGGTERPPAPATPRASTQAAAPPAAPVPSAGSRPAVATGPAATATTRPAAPTPPAVSPPPPAARPPLASAPAPSLPPARTAPTVPSEQPEVARQPPPGVAARPLPPVAAPPSGRGWTVQANPTRNRDEADALFRQLKTRGYEVSIVRVLRDGDTWYRVQVGRFASSEQATETMQRLREREGVTHVFVASE